MISEKSLTHVLLECFKRDIWITINKGETADSFSFEMRKRMPKKILGLRRVVNLERIKKACMWSDELIAMELQHELDLFDKLIKEEK